MKRDSKSIVTKKRKSKEEKKKEDKVSLLEKALIQEGLTFLCSSLVLVKVKSGIAPAISSFTWGLNCHPKLLRIINTRSKDATRGSWPYY